MTPEHTFKRGAVKPVDCIKQGWELIKDQYWLFLGMAVVGTLIGNPVPFGILAGPLMCGLYLALFKRLAGERLEFGMLFKGLDFFVDGMIAGILHTVPVYIIVAPIYFVYIAMMVFVQVGARHGEPDPGAMVGFLTVIAICVPIMLILLLIVGIGLAFAYPLVADRRLPGLEAVKLSFKAGMANFWGLFGLLLLNGLMTFAGGLACGIGAWFVLPITIAALAVAYTQVFGVMQARPAYTPPLPPSFN